MSENMRSMHDMELSTRDCIMRELKSDLSHKIEKMSNFD